MTKLRKGYIGLLLKSYFVIQEKEFILYFPEFNYKVFKFEVVF